MYIVWAGEPAMGELLRGPDVNYQHLSLPIDQGLQFLKCDRCHVDISLCQVQKKILVGCLSTICKKTVLW